MRNDDAGEAVLITGASNGIGALSVRAMALAGPAVYAGIRRTTTRKATTVVGPARYGTDHQDVELDVTCQGSSDAEVDRIFAERGRPDVVVHNAGHTVLGAAEAFTIGPNHFACDPPTSTARKSTASDTGP
ncbi:SDR family NAD(P)-dependent oxidoreductase [Streptomyces sp. NPDC053560]|uniref:SDR family NAD(P)-dependent oxidoreductase n=1 Tax=Streptomyces sp. NPDC053560 TaxID=3365711 RepID=UPI0037D66A89